MTWYRVIRQVFQTSKYKIKCQFLEDYFTKNKYYVLTGNQGRKTRGIEVLTQKLKKGGKARNIFTHYIAYAGSL